jgi:hypothetical protein
VAHLFSRQNGESVAPHPQINQAMIQAGVDVLLFFDPERSDPAEYARKIYRAMAEVSDSEP